MGERMRSRVTEGMAVRSTDGQKLGRVVACQPGGFVVEKGFLFPRDTLVSYERITNIADGEVILSLTQEELREPVARAGSAGATARATVSSMTEEVKEAAHRAKEAITGTTTTGHNGGSTRETLAAFGTAGEIRVPLVEEEIIATKRIDTIGEIHVKKQVITEEKQITVPVMREVIRVERVPVSHEAHAEDRPFEEASFDIPVREEHVMVEKHPVVHEELRLNKEVERVEETAKATVRRERAEVETTGTVRRAEGAAAALRPTGTGGR